MPTRRAVLQCGAAAALAPAWVHFAGEHTAQSMSGMEGAKESGERAASEILEQLG